MAIDPRKVQVAKIVCEEFATTRRGSTRHPLIVAIKDPFLLDQMTTQNLLREEEERTIFLPTLGTYALLPDGDPKFIAAKAGTIQVLQTLHSIFEKGPPYINLTIGQVQEAARDLFGPIHQATFNLGLYLVDFPALSAVQGYARMDDHIGIRFLTISERIMMIDDPEAAWQRCVEMSRRNAQIQEAAAPEAPPTSRSGHPSAAPSKGKQKGWVPRGWNLGKFIAEGGQGWTYKVQRSSQDDGEWFVFKRLKNAARAKRFESEIKALRRLEHPGILRIVEDGIAEEKPYYIAEYCQNGDLSKRNFRGVTTLEKLLLFRQICSAVAAIHSAEIVHRDIKPSNILVRGDGTIAVGDFGLCLHLEAEQRLTEAAEAVGARYYMAPELADGRREDVTPAADVYSLGKLLYFIFSGRTFSREDHRELTYDLTRPSQGQPEQGIQFVYELLDKSITRDAESRFPDAGALVTAVDGVIHRILLNAHVLDITVKQHCIYCVEGEYQPMQGGQADANAMTVVCRRCGHFQRFNSPHNGWNPWWLRR